MIAALMFAAAVAGASDPAGLWRTPERHGLVEITHCGTSLCGRLVASDKIRQNPAAADENNQDPKLRTRPLKGLELFKDFKGAGGSWTGSLYNPADGGTYKGSLEMQGPDQLTVKGCIFGPLCKTQTWDRAPADAARQ